ncbi:uncharacterized membrane protein YidH (DUF202 family) [Caldalkalibacillus uzonensis]|uniref:Uncharacterized membrane protein YidH (DUF202 family) n=1 Tax=Caldalkalibacillus uzonensis TaxID=353224 RepID=A0ABU0CN73_9BACI|nr:hypothetical protein [Caldalkalibacillus uzonensis]MDQ0337870.1 uncharacterized membrane protein YidH (DUF202 family) [Caldalkalibacillus uzonensis]
MNERMWWFCTIGFFALCAFGFLFGALYQYDINKSVTLFITERRWLQITLIIISTILGFITMLNMLRIQTKERKVKPVMIAQVIGWTALIWTLLSINNGRNMLEPVLNVLFNR